MKTILYSSIFLITVSFTSNAQSKFMQMKQKYDFMYQMHKKQNLKNFQSDANKQTQRLRLKINPYWQDVDAPHTYNSYVPQIKVPCFNTVWGVIKYDSSYPEKHFLRTADGGKTWRNDTINAPAGDDLGVLSAIDANTCYATTIDANDGKGGGVYKTINGGTTWKKLNGFNDSSFIDFVYFFDADNGLVVADNNGVDTVTLQIYTTKDAGKTWQRVPKKNIPPTANAAFSIVFNAYTTHENRIWFKAYDSQGKLYLYRSDDYGHHFQLFSFPEEEFGFDFAFEDRQNGIAVGFPFDGVNQSFEAVTHDGGETWTQKTDFTGYVMGGFVTVIPGTHTYVSTLPGFTPVFGSSYSRDGGNSWTLIDTSVEHSAIAFLNPFIGWTGRAETYEYENGKGGAFKWKLHFSLDNNSIAANNENISSATKTDLNNAINARLYPNPAKDVVKVEGLNASAKTTLSLYNLSGRLIQQSSTTSSSHTISLQNLATGSYYIKIQTGEKISTLKFVKE